MITNARSRWLRTWDSRRCTCFPFSPRPGTEAAVMKPVITERIRRERASELGALSRKLSADYVRRWAGREVAALLAVECAAPLARRE